MNIMKNEIWRDIKGYEGLYQISNLGRVKSLGRKSYSNVCLKDKILNPALECKNGYKRVCLCKDGKEKRIKVHRLVAQAFIPNPNNLPEVNHIKEFEKTNNKVENLEWCDHSYNQNYGTRNKRVSEKMSRIKCKKVDQYDLEGNYIKTWNSIKEAEKEVGSTHISQCTKGRFKQTKGYVWRYAEEGNNE